MVIATGAQARWLGIPGEKELGGFGVSACATCDGFFYRGKDVAVIGGGNSAVEEALYLSNLARHVTLIHRRDSLRAEKILQQRLFAKPNVTVLWDTRGRGGAGRRVAAACRSRAAWRCATRAPASGSELAVDGVFVAIGHAPATALFQGQVEMDAEGYIVHRAGHARAPRSPACSPPATCRTRSIRQAVTAAGTGCMAALEARSSSPPPDAETEQVSRRMPIDWDKLRVFHAVAEAGSFTHAGETLNLSQSAVSRQIQALEEALTVPLFHRHARGLILTEQGETLNRTVREVFAKLAMTEALLTESRERPAGRLKVTTTTGFGSSWLAPRLRRLPRPAPRDQRDAAARRFRPRPRDARGRCRHPHASAAAAGPDPAPHRDLRLEGLRRRRATSSAPASRSGSRTSMRTG